MKKKTEPVLELPVAFGNVTIGDETASLRLTAGRGVLSVARADKTLCGHRLTGTITATPNGDGPALPGTDLGETALSAVFDVKSYSVKPKEITFGLTFALSSVDPGELARFARRGGRFKVEEVEDLPESEANGEGD